MEATTELLGPVTVGRLPDLYIVLNTQSFQLRNILVPHNIVRSNTGSCGCRHANVLVGEIAKENRRPVKRHPHAGNLLIILFLSYVYRIVFGESVR